MSTGLSLLPSPALARHRLVFESYEAARKIEDALIARGFERVRSDGRWVLRARTYQAIYRVFQRKVTDAEIWFATTEEEAREILGQD